MAEFFSERNGLISSMNNDYSPAFRSAIVTSFFNQYDFMEEDELIWRLQEVMDLFGIEQHPQVHEKATLKSNKEHILEYFKFCPWNHIFDFAEYVLKLDTARADLLAEKYNRIFRMHGCRYRLVNGKAIPVLNDLEIREISKAMNTGIEAVDSAYNEAITLFSNKTEPDYNAVIAKVSNALESMVLAIGKENTGSAETLGRAIAELENKGIVFDEDMKALIKKIYGYACNAGIRHGGTDPVTATEEDAILLLVISAAGIDYLNTLRKR